VSPELVPVDLSVKLTANGVVHDESLSALKATVADAFTVMYCFFVVLAWQPFTSLTINEIS
jgi:hypothetical protein